MTEATSERVVVCRVGDRTFALAVGVVREVCTGIAVVRMPGVAAPVDGVANVRGTLVTVIRGGALLGVPAHSAEPSPWLVVLRARGGRIGIGVDDVLELDDGAPAATRFDVLGALEGVFGRIQGEGS